MLFAELSGIKGIGPKTAVLFTQLLLKGATEAVSARLIDLLLHMPTGAIDRRYRCTISQLPVQGIVTVAVTIGKHHPPPPHMRRLPYKVDVFDNTGAMSLVFFKAFPEQLNRLLPEGQQRIVSGEITWFGSQPQISHPDHVVRDDQFETLPKVEPVYPLTAGLSSKTIIKALREILPKLPIMPEWQDPHWLKSNSFPPFTEALRLQHAPPDPSRVDPLDASRLRLAYDELLANQLALALVRHSMRRAKGRPILRTGKIRSHIQLPFKLTHSQVTASAEIEADMAGPDRMLRLLQGDVGSGKTVVAFLAMVTAAEAATQSALMVPTELLARQHYATLLKLAEGSPLQIAILTGREKGKVRDDILTRLSSGDIHIIVGTHALFQAGVKFHNLGLAVIDEQHRFGVHQRLALQGSTGMVDVLAMTATPIPRTLALTAYGDMDVSKLTDKPPGRHSVETRTISTHRTAEVLGGIGRAIGLGARIYWVCPLIEESEHLDLIAAQDRFDELNSIYGSKVEILHGRMKAPDKDAVMEKFKNGELSILVSTTVIEVGVDVPEATIMVIEHAERFGLAQLHQLRGRVGRGRAQSSCVLLYQEPLGEIAKARLSIMRETEDGFRIAEEDLKLRGAGEMLGTQQSGLQEFRLADLNFHGELLAAARDDAQLILSKDPQLLTERGDALRHLLYVFERDVAIRLLAAG